MKVRLSDDARNYLRQEAQYLRDRSPAAAKAFTASIAKARQNLQAFVEIGFESDDLPVVGMRRLIVGDYLLDYERTADAVHVVSIRSSRQAPQTPRDPDFDYESGSAVDLDSSAKK